jgi:hypothetical protein
MAYQRWFGAALMGLVAWMQAPNLSWSALESCGSGKVEHDPLSLYGDEMVFSVLRDGDPIGIHRVTFDVDGDRLLVGSRFEARVKVLFITAFEYLYESQSVWRDGCLVELKAITDDNGTKSRVSARLANGQLVIEGPSGAMRGKAGMFPTDHWHSGVLQSDRVLNTITGQVARVNIADMGEGQVTVNDSPEAARRYVYSGDLQTEVWYDREGRWVKMRFRADDGSTIEYVCRKCRRASPRDPA